MTIIWCMVPEIWNATDKFFWQLGRHSLLFYLPSNPENQNFKKMKKKNAWRYHPFTQVYQKSWSYLCYSWDMACDGCNFFIFHFGLFFTLTGWKIKVLKKWKKRLEISSFYTCVPKTMITWCMVPEIWCKTDGRK